MSRAGVLPEIQPDFIEFSGGMDQITPSLSLKPGVCRDGLNFECAIPMGNARIGGYERFDGRLKPADATYSILQLSALLTTPTLGITVTGQTSGTTATLIALDTMSPYLIVTLVVGGGFTIGETILNGATPIGVSVEVATDISKLLDAQYLNAAADIYRSLISAPSGSGALRGVFSMINSGVHEVFAFRDNAGATASVLYKSTSSGWTVVAFQYEVSFTAGGTGQPNDGDTLTEGGVTALIKRVMLESGSWAAGTAAGRFIIVAPSGGNFSAGAATAGTVAVTLSGIQTAITMLPGGTFEFDEGNFEGRAGGLRIYGCDGVNRGFEFDGVTLCPIKTGMPVDAPTHVAVHQSCLVFSYKSSVLTSGTGLPYMFTAISGSTEFASGDLVRGFKVLPGSQDSPALLTITASSIKILYGSAAGGSNPFRLVHFNVIGSGGVARTQQNLDQTYYLSTTGLTNLQRVNAFGNFVSSTLTFPVKDFITEKLSLVVASSVHLTKSQYRLFCSDGYGFYLTIVNGQSLGGFPVFFPNPVTCIWHSKLSNDNAVTYFGSSNGMVYQLDRGSSFDGAAIDFYLTPNWASQRSPRTLKTYHYASLDMNGTAYAAIDFEYTLGFGQSDQPKQGSDSVVSNFSGAPRWDSGIKWDQFIWDGATLGPVMTPMDGEGENVQCRLSGSSDYLYPFSVNSLTIHFIPRRPLRYTMGGLS